VRGDGGRHAAPYDRRPEARPAQDLGHLRDVPEHVRQVADRHRPAELLGAPPAHLQVADDALPTHQEFVHQDLPGSDRQPPLADEALDPRARLRPNLQVVVDRRQLPVQGEGEVRLALEHLQDAIDELDELHAERLEGPVPLPVPVGVRDQEDTGGGRHAESVATIGR
jgi:hypothetical protein